MKTLIPRMLASIAVGLMALASPLMAQTTVTSFAPETNTTPGVWFENDVRTGGTASITDLTGLGGDLEINQPLPSGAAKITTNFTNAAKAEVGVAADYGTVAAYLASLEVGYSWHKAANSGQNSSAAPSLKLTFFNPVCDDPASAGDCYGTLVYEPYQNGFGNPAVDTWNRSELDYTNGTWWWTGGFGFPNGGGGGVQQTLANWGIDFSTDFQGASLVSVSIGVGSYNQGQIGYFDEVTIAGTNADASYDFEPAPQFETVGECVSTLIADNCADQKGRARATCNHEQQMTCFDIFDIK